MPTATEAICGQRRIDFHLSLNRRTAIRSGEESVLCSTALLRRGFISADFPLRATHR